MKTTVMGFLPLFATITIHAATIQVNDAESALDTYALLGAASICSDSKNIGFEERYEFAQIHDHYDAKRRESNLKPNIALERDLAKERYGIEWSTDPSLSLCKNALVK
ncbi:hypothetical protein ABXZ88_003220 [Vibrio fluvialis]